MPTVYIAGDGPDLGVTATATGLAFLSGDAALAKAASFRAPDPDAAFHRALGLPSAPEGWPVALTSADDAAEAAAGIAGTALPAGLSVIEGVSGAPSPAEGLRADAAIAAALNAPVILVTSPDTADAEAALAAFGERLHGVIINRVPAYGARGAETAAAFRQRDVPVLGLIPEDRRMLAPTVGAIAERLGAACINVDALEDPEAAMAALVEHVMLGGLFLDTGVYVFGRREQKAVIVRGDRPDLQMAAMDTSTVCLVLTEGRHPVQYIVHYAQLEQTPMLLTARPTLETMEALHGIGDDASVHSPHKARRFAELLADHCDLSGLTATAPLA